ncbi:fibronectin type III domain-containing protein [Aeromicrobium massiliense]|uniref:fibronectin type III domain-containing protein n=1 Tax=Aeromicrobium massiliense TaxID=1464554 RepID=UPI0005785604|nr:fibronectin type III domain-containing protein [Aeromicrobium massiliense]
MPRRTSAVLGILAAIVTATLVAAPAQAASKTPAKVGWAKVSAAKPTSFTVSYASASRAKRYQVQWSTRSTFAGAGSTTRSQRSALVQKLRPGTRYYVRVRGVNGSKRGRWSPTAVGQTAITTPLKGIRVDREDFDGRSIRVRWDRATNVTGYELKWSTSRQMTSARYRTVTTTSAWISGVTPGRTLYLQVRARKGALADGWSTVRDVALRARRPASFPSGSSAFAVRPAANGVTVTWSKTADSTHAQATVGPLRSLTGIKRWTPWAAQTQKTGTKVSLTVPARDADLTSVAYGNPLWVQLWAKNGFAKGDYAAPRSSHGTVGAALPTPTTPASGLPVRVGSWNVMCEGCNPDAAPWSTRAPRLASAVNVRDLDVLAVQEAVAGGMHAWNDLDSRLSGLAVTESAVYSPNPQSNQGNRIYYRGSKLALQSKGVFGLTYAKSMTTTQQDTMNVPWARFRPVGAADAAQDFYVVAVHLPAYVGDNAAVAKRLGQVAQQLRTKVDAATEDGVPVVIAGDLNSQLYHEAAGQAAGTPGPQTTLVRSGFYDSAASQAPVNLQYASFNKLTARTPDPSGYGLRIDHILTRGIAGSTRFENVVSYDGSVSSTPPSDHNLIVTDLQVPARP